MGFLRGLFKPNIEKLAQSGDLERLASVIATDSDDELRVSAVAAVAGIANDAAITTLVNALASTSDRVSTAAARCLKEKGPDAAPALAATLGSADGDRPAALLLELGDGARPALCEAARSAAAEPSRIQALDLLSQLHRSEHDEQATELYLHTALACLGDRAPQCRAAAAAGLETIGDTKAGRALASQLKDGDDEVRAACRSALASLGDAVVPDLVEALRDRNPRSRQLAAGLLGELCGPTTLLEDRRLALIAVMEGISDSAPEISGACQEAVGRIPAEDVVEQQLERLIDPEQGGDDETLELLHQLLTHNVLAAEKKARIIDRISSHGFNLDL